MNQQPFVHRHVGKLAVAVVALGIAGGSVLGYLLIWRG